MSATPQALTVAQAAGTMPQRLAAAEAALAAPREALMPPQAQVSAVLADIAAAGPSDALLDMQEALDELNLRLKDVRTMKPATAALMFGSDAAWRGCLSRLGVEIGRRMTALGAARRAAGLELDFSLSDIATPITPGASLSGVRRTGD
jgi:hypothetical protein